MKTNTFLGAMAGAALLAVGAMPNQAEAAPLFTVTSQLTGDPRPGSPTGLVVDVTVVVDAATPNRATFTVDLNTVAHPGARLEEFGWNLLNTGGKYNASNVAFQNITPPGWASTGVFQLNNQLQGSGNMVFLWTGDGPSGNSAANNVTNSVNLVFDMVLTSGSFAAADFTGAPTSSGAGGALVGQLGAHLQSLTDGASGTAVGNWRNGNGNGGGGGVPVPEPGTLALLGAGLLGLGLARRARRTA